MVDEKYWGWSATGRRPLADVEVNRLIVERRGRRDDFRDRLEGLSTDLDPPPPAQRRFGHLHVIVEPESAWLGPPLSDVLADKLPMQGVLDSLSFHAQ